MLHTTQCVYCACCIQFHLHLKSKRSQNKRRYLGMPFYLVCRRKLQTCFLFAGGCVKPWFKHPECNFSIASEGTEIMAYLGGCIVHCVKVDLNFMGTSQENLHSICKPYQGRAGCCGAFWSKRHQAKQIRFINFVFHFFFFFQVFVKSSPTMCDTLKQELLVS